MTQRTICITINDQTCYRIIGSMKDPPHMQRLEHQTGRTLAEGRQRARDTKLAKSAARARARSSALISSPQTSDVDGATLGRSRRGGVRAGAGRKPRSAKAGVPHLVRPQVTSHKPLHVTLRVRRDIWNLRSKRCFRLVRRALIGVRARFAFRVVHYSVQRNHVHLIVEAENERCLARAMQGLSVRLARSINQLMSRNGKVLEDRYHARVLHTALEVRRALGYVLNNARKHAIQRGERLPDLWTDPYSSAAYFDGWLEVLAEPRRAPETRACSPPLSRLLRLSWRVYGRISIAHIPGQNPACLVGNCDILPGEHAMQRGHAQTGEAR